MTTDNQVSYTSAGDGDKLLKKYMRLFELSWKSCRPFMEIANEDIAQFNQEISESWPTMSEITLAQARLMVDQALPPIIAGLFGAENPFELLPQDNTISYETARKIRDWVLYNMLTNMRLETEGYLSIKEGVKLGKGYGIVEPQIITPPISEQQTILAGAEEITNRVMGIGNVELVPGYSYLPFGTVVPTPDGAHPDNVSCTFVLRMYQEERFRKMFDKKLNPDTPFEGNVEKIIERARLKMFNGYLSTPRQIAAQIANASQTPMDAMNEAGSDTPVIIPVLQCYAHDEHVWFACDQFKIYHVKSKYQTLRSPVVDVTFDPDGNEWFTPGIIRPRRRMIMGVENFHNAVMDLISMILHPHSIVNQDALLSEEEKTDLQPYGRTNIAGSHKTGDVVSWAQLPPMPPQLFEAGNRLETHNEASAGQPRSLQGQGTPGLVRGGSGAMEALQAGTSGREKLQTKHMETGWYSAVVENALVLCQMLAKKKQYLPVLKYQPEDKKNKSKYDYAEITRDDIRRVYAVRLGFTEKMKNELAEVTRKTLIYDRGIQNENVNRSEAFAWLVGNDKDYTRLTAGVNIKENIATMQALAARAGTRPGAGAAPANETPAIGGAGITAGGLPQ